MSNVLRRNERKLLLESDVSGVRKAHDFAWLLGFNCIRRARRRVLRLGADHFPPLSLRRLPNPLMGRILPDASETAGRPSPRFPRRRSAPAAAIPVHRTWMHVRKAARAGTPAA